MGIQKKRHIITWLVVMAYVMLLAHVFVPHHHHDDQTAFINLTYCPHDHHHGNEDHHGHESHEHTHTASCTGSGQCETLKHTLLKNSVLDMPDFELIGFPLCGMLVEPTNETTVLFSPNNRLRSPQHFSHNSEHHLFSWSHRGPPARS